MSKADNGLSVHTEAGGWRISAQYRPAEYIALMETEQSESPSAEEYAQRLQELNGQLHINLRFDSQDKNKEFLKVGLQSQQEYFQRLQYLETQIAEDLVLLDGNDTLPCLLHHFERTYQMSSYGDISLVFEPKNKTSKADKVLVFHDRMLGCGSLQFRFEQNKLQQIPLLRIHEQ